MLFLWEWQQQRFSFPLLSSNILLNSLHKFLPNSNWMSPPVQDNQRTSLSPHLFGSHPGGSGYLAVTIQRPRATLAANKALPASSKQNPISSRFWRSVITVTKVASRNAFSIHWPSRAKHGTEFTTANAPERDTTYLRGRQVKENSCCHHLAVILKVYHD